MSKMTVDMVYTKPTVLWDTIDDMPQFCSICDPDDRKPYTGPYELEKHISEMHDDRGESKLADGIVHFHAGRYTEAIADFDLAERLGYNQPELWGCRASAKFKLGLYQDAMADFDHADQLAPRQSVMYSFRGATMFHLGFYADALIDLNKLALSIRDNPMATLESREFAFLYRGKTYFHLNKFLHAFVDFQYVNLLKPDQAETLKYMGATSFMLGNRLEALVDLNSANELDPDDAFTLSYLGAIKFKLNRFDEAIVDLTRALEIGPCEPFVMQCLDNARRMANAEARLHASICRRTRRQ
jgi:Flp pilus assembly protein TadD